MFDFSVNLLQAILWQYDKAARLVALLTAKQEWYDREQTAFWSDWVRDVFDLQTANEFGQSVWARILGVPLVVGAAASGARPVFGFGAFNRNFFNGTFGRDASGVVGLTVEQRRLLLRLRYFQLISNGSVTQSNFFMRVLFGSGVYVLDGHDMTCEYVFETAPDAQILFVLEAFDLLPRPAGVGLSILIRPGDSFGFDPYYLNFENSNFRG